MKRWLIRLLGGVPRAEHERTVSNLEAVLDSSQETIEKREDYIVSLLQFIDDSGAATVLMENNITYERGVFPKKVYIHGESIVLVDCEFGNIVEITPTSKYCSVLMPTRLNLNTEKSETFL